jgi:type IV secretory pathway TrbD component
MLIAALSAVVGVVVALFSSARDGLLVFGVGVVVAVLWYARRPPPPRTAPPQP